MVHDMSLTERFAVVYDLPITFSLDLASEGMFPYSWNDDHPARLGVLPREGTAADLRWFDVEPCYVFHPLNAHEERDGEGEGRIVLDVVRHHRTFVSDRTGPASEGTEPPTLWRWTLDLDSGRTTEQQLDDRGQEFPRVAESRVGRKARYGWSVELGTGALSVAPSSNILRHDLTTGRVDVHPAGSSRHVGEAVAIPREGGDPDRDDDAWLMALAHDRDTDRGELVVWAADDPGADPVARVPLPARVPFGFHGSWVPTGT
jgi:carotenoid cleavage dioxygenase